MSEAKKFVIVPADALDCLTARFAVYDDAVEAATVRCSEDGQRIYVLELKAVAARADRPVKVTKL